MPRRGEYAPVPHVPAAAPPVARIGVRRATSRETLTTTARTTSIDPARFVCCGLVGELADEWVAWAQVARPGAEHFAAARQAVLLFAGYVDAHAPDPGSLTLASDAPDVAVWLREWRRHLPSVYAPGSAKPGQAVGMVRMLMRRRAERADVRTGAPVRVLLSGPSGLRSGKYRELDEFSRAEKAALLRAAWAGVRGGEARLGRGRAMLARAAGHPAEHGWQDPANLLWALAEGALSTTQIRAMLPHPDTWPHSLTQLAATRCGPWRQGISRYRMLLRELAHLLYPCNADLHAFRVLLMAATGYTPEEVATFTDADVEFGEGHVGLTMTKERAHLVRHRRFPDRESAAFPDYGPLNTAEIVRRLLALTERARRGAGRAPCPVFVHTYVDESFRMHFNFNRLNTNSYSFPQWAAEQGVELSAPVDIRRLRKSGKVEKAIAYRGVVSDIADDHTQATFLGHYAHGTTLHVLSGHVVTTAQQVWLDRALRGPVLLGEQAADNLEASETLAALGISRQTAERVREGALNMGVAECRDPFDSPYSKPGDLCAVAPLHCLECGNALILPSNLPQLLLFADFVEQLNRSMDPPLFHAVWGQRQTNLQAALKERGDAEIEAARRHIQEAGLRLQLPLSARAEFDR